MLGATINGALTPEQAALSARLRAMVAANPQWASSPGARADFEQWAGKQGGGWMHDGGDQSWFALPSQAQDGSWDPGKRNSGEYEQELRSFFERVYTPDASGQLPWGSSGLNFTTSPIGQTLGSADEQLFVNINGKPMYRTGSNLADWNAGPLQQKVAASLGGLHQLSQFDPEHGWVIPAEAFKALNKAGETDYADSGLQSIFSAAPMILGSIAGGAALGGYFPGIDAMTGASIPAGQTGILSQLGIGNPFTSDASWGVNPRDTGAVADAGGNMSGWQDYLNAATDTFNPFDPGINPLDQFNVSSMVGDTTGVFSPWSPFNPGVNPLDQFNVSGIVGDTSFPFLNPEWGGAIPNISGLVPGSGNWGVADALSSGFSIPDWVKKFGKGLLGNNGGGSIEQLLGGDLGGLLGQGVGLAARLAPGWAALEFARNQSDVDTSPLSSLMSRGYGAAPDLSQFSNLSNQVGGITDPMRSSVLQDFDMRSGQARGDLMSGLQRRGVMGSSFGNMDIGNFDATMGAQRGKLAGDLGLQGLTMQRGLAQDIMGAQERSRTFDLNATNSQANIASQLLNSQLQQKAIQNALYGRAFDIMGRAVSPSPSLFGGR